MNKVMTIPAGRLAQWKGRNSWIADVQKGSLKAANQDKERPKYSEDSNRFPVLMVVYAPDTDTSLSKIINKELRELAYALATCSNPKPTTKEEKRATWHKTNSHLDSTDLAIPYFEYNHLPQQDRLLSTNTVNPDAMQNDDELG
jgi:hypothetical protein